MKRISLMSLLLALFGAGLFLYYGYLSRNAVLQANNCKMTYSKLEKHKLKIPGVSSSYSLWKISNAGNSALGVQPVLFVPGHLGSVNQARSLASAMHNDDGYFQYFSLDFAEEHSAIHGSEILSKASFLNVALMQIRTMYYNDALINKRRTDRERKIIVVGHSIGGTIARVAVTLSNHPKCIVGDIVMLSTPVVSAPYAPDPSMDLLYQALNKAWILSFYNTSSACQQSALAFKHNAKLYDVRNAEVLRNVTVEADFTCPVCAPFVRLVSISGGLVDMNVVPDLTTVHEIAARPRNITLNSVKNKGSGSVLGAASAVASGFTRLLTAVTFNMFAKLYGLIFGAKIDVTPIPMHHGNSSASATISEICAADNETCIAAAGNATEAVQAQLPKVYNVSGTYAFVTPESWREVILPYVEPQIHAIRTVQMPEVGFPIDHQAMLWCYQLLQIVTKGMRMLSATPSSSMGAVPESSHLDLTQVFAFRDSASIAHELSKVKSLELQQLEGFIVRNESFLLWKTADAEELQFVQGVLRGSTLQSMAFLFFTQHLTKILVCYLLVSCAALSAFYLRAMTGNLDSPLTPLTSYNLLWPQVHFSADIMTGILVHVAQWALPAEVIPGLIRRSIQGLVVISALRILYDAQFPSYFFSSYSPLLNWLVAYALAIALRLAALLGLNVVRFVWNKVQWIGRTILRWTVWNKFIRRSVKKAGKKVKETLVKRVPFGATAVAFMEWALRPLVPVSIVASICLQTAQRLRSPMSMNLSVYALSVLSVTVYGLAVAGIVCGILSSPFPKHSHTISYYFFKELLLGFAAVPLVALPSLHFAVKLLYYPVSDLHRMSSSYLLFGPERIHYCMALAIIAAGTWLLRRKKDFIEQIKPLLWMEELAGPQVLRSAFALLPNSAAAGDAFGMYFSLKGLKGGAAGSSSCLHEDGGKDAIFEKVQNSSQQSVGVFGTSYRVVFCNCAKNTALKDESEWCEWCRCSKCGGKHLPRSRFGSGDGKGKTAPLDGQDYSVELFVFVGLIAAGVLTVLNVQAKPFLYLYYAGIVAFALTIQCFYR